MQNQFLRAKRGCREGILFSAAKNAPRAAVRMHPPLNAAVKARGLRVGFDTLRQPCEHNKSSPAREFSRRAAFLS